MVLHVLPRRYSWPRPLYPNDIFLVSYPRSGNTWVRFLIGNLLRGAEEDPVDFHTLPEAVPNLQDKSHWPLIRNMSPPRLLKMHELPDRRFRRVIYILRDGRDVTVSYYNYLCGLGKFQGSFPEFLRSRYGPWRWARHVSAWLNNPEDRELVMVRYEDLLVDTAQQLRRIAEFANLPDDEDSIARAVRHSRFENVKKMEGTRGRPRWNDTNLKFARKGKAGDWQNWFEPAHIEEFNRQAGHILRQFGYADAESE